MMPAKTILATPVETTPGKDFRTRTARVRLCRALDGNGSKMNVSVAAEKI
jgi:hypothetical protein